MTRQQTTHSESNTLSPKTYNIIRKLLKIPWILILLSFTLTTILLGNKLYSENGLQTHQSSGQSTGIFRDSAPTTITVIATPNPTTSPKATISALESPKPSIKTDNPAERPKEQYPKLPIYLQALNASKVIRVIDGDTIVITLNQTHFKLRYIGINTPEYKTNACLAQKATDINKALVLNKPVLIAKDTRETDKYGRLLRYVFVPKAQITSNKVAPLLKDSKAIYTYNGVEYIFVNQFLVEQGYAEAMTIPPDTKFAELFQELNQTARKLKKGLYSESVCPGYIAKSSDTPKAAPPPTSSHTSTSTIKQGSACNNVTCSYNAYNCSDFSSYQQAYYVYQCCLQQTGKDIHRLDRDKDGIPCESLRR